MDSIIPVVLLVGIVVLVALVIGYSLQAAARRREELFALSYELGLEFSIDDPVGIPLLYAGFAQLSEGYDQHASNVLRGRLGDYDVTGFDYAYTTGSGKSKSTHRMSAVIVDAEVAFESLLIRPETFMDRAAGVFGFDDIDFESEEFSRAFYVKCADKQFAYDVIHSRMMEYLLLNRGWSIEMSGRSVMTYTGSSFSPEDFRRAFRLLEEFLKLLPDYLWQKLREKLEAGC